MISFSLSEEQLQLHRTAAKFAREEIRPLAAEHDRKPDPRDSIPSDEQKDQWLSEICSDTSGTYLTAFAAAEPSSGSDLASEDPAAGVRTTAVRDGDSYVLNETKCFCTNGGLARLYVVFAETDPAKGASRGLSAFIVPLSPSRSPRRRSTSLQWSPATVTEVRWTRKEGNDSRFTKQRKNQSVDPLLERGDNQ